MTLRAPGRFLICALGFLFFSSAALSAVCDPQLDKKLCVSDHANSRLCKSLPESYKQYHIEEQLFELFQNSPEMVQLGFCGLEQIRLVKDWGEQIHPGFASNKRITISRAFAFNIALLSSDTAWRRVVYFNPGYTPAKPCLLLDGASTEKKLDVVPQSGFVPRYEFSHFIIHELAHIIEQDWSVNEHAMTGYFACEYASQILNGSPANGVGYTAIFPNQFGVEADSSAYLRLGDSGMATFYAAYLPIEDFAELFADYVLLEHFGINYTIEKDAEVLFDRAKQFENENIQNKLAIVKKVLEWPKMSAGERQAFADDRTHCRGIFSPYAG